MKTPSNIDEDIQNPPLVSYINHEISRLCSIPDHQQDIHRKSKIRLTAGALWSDPLSASGGKATWLLGFSQDRESFDLTQDRELVERQMMP